MKLPVPEYSFLNNNICFNVTRLRIDRYGNREPSLSLALSFKASEYIQVVLIGLYEQARNRTNRR